MRRNAAGNSGFTLIELMVVVAVVAILGAIALPTYQQYVQRGKITEATSTLSELRLKAEKWFSDNRTYVTGTPNWTTVAGTRYFAYDCVTPAVPTVSTYTCRAVGIANQGMTGFTYTINQDNTKTSTFTGLSGWNNSTTCWVTKKGDSC